MSLQEVQVEQSQEKVGLKRKLTGPPRLLLGKFRAKTQGDNQTEAQTQGSNGISDSKRHGMGSPRNQLGDTGDHDSPSSARESLQILTGKQSEMPSKQAPAVALEVCSTAKKSEAEVEGWDDESMVKERAKKRYRRWFQSPSLVCFRSSCGEQGADGFHRDAKTSPVGKLIMDYSTSPSKDLKVTVSQYQGGALTEQKGGFSDRTRSTLKRLITFNKPEKPKGACSEPEVQHGSKDQLHPKAFFRKKMGLFFKQGSKNSSTSAENRGTRVTLDKETMGLPPPRPGEASLFEGVRSEASAKFGGNLTVSVEVSALRQGGVEKRNPVEGSIRADGYGGPVGLRMIAEEYKPRRCSKDELDRPERRLKCDLPSKTAGGLPPVMEEAPATEKDLDWSPGDRADSRKDRLKGSDARLPLDVAHVENYKIPESLHTENVMGACHSLSGIVLEGSVQDPLNLNGIDCLGYLSRDTVPIDTDIVVTNGPMGSPLEDLHLGGRSHINNLPYGESVIENGETLLVQTASSLVQAALKTALGQLTAELEAAAVHQEAQACKCQP